MGTRWKTRAALAALCLLVSTAAAQTPAAAKIGELAEEVARITGMKVRKPVRVEALTREEWKRYVEAEIGRQVKPEEIRADQLVLQLLGLVPRDFDLKQATIDLLAEQAAAVYDHRRKRMLLLEGGHAGAADDAVLVHELAHAVADQHYSMERFLDKGAKTGEQQAARLAVVEGQAMWVMLEWQFGKSGIGSVSTNREALERMLPALGSMAAASYPVFAKSPLYLQETLLFPYTAGVLFQQAVIEKMGKRAFRAVLEKPPSTTHEILHPEAWLEGRRLEAPPAPVPENERDYRRLSAGILGELDLRVLLKQYCSEEDARRLGAQWRGGSYELLEHRRSGRPALRWSAAFSEEAAAQDFLDRYRRVLEGKSSGLQWREAGKGRLEGINSDGAFRVELRGAAVGAMEGLEPREGPGRPAL
ncbi:MAG: hypothetical protein WHT08_14105 [Bryobacteraceae bacterium]|jgi:hypothetical protein